MCMLYTETRNRLLVAFFAAVAMGVGAGAAEPTYDYRVLATSRTSTMEKELNEAAADGFRFSRVMGGRATNGGQVLIAMVREAGVAGRKYRLLATSRTSTMEREMQALADAGYGYVDHTVFESVGGGKEVAVIMELDASRPAGALYRLLATTRAGTMEKELREAGAQGFALVGSAAGKTVGGSEVIAILRKER